MSSNADSETRSSSFSLVGLPFRGQYAFNPPLNGPFWEVVLIPLLRPFASREIIATESGAVLLAGRARRLIPAVSVEDGDGSIESVTFGGEQLTPLVGVPLSANSVALPE